MPGKNTLKFIASLKQKKYRQLHQLFIIEGEKIVDELLSGDFAVHSIYATLQWLDERKIKPGNTEFPVYEISQGELGRISSLSAPNKVLAIVHKNPARFDPASIRNSLTLALDNIQDPGNLGTLIRTCDWFGITDIICSENSAESTNPKVIQSSMGSILRVRVHYLPLAEFLSLPVVKELPVIGAYADAGNMYGVTLPAGGIIVLGNESHGISPEIEKYITHKLSIPEKPGRENSPESLNVAVAGSIIIAEFKRRGAPLNAGGNLRE